MHRSSRALRRALSYKAGIDHGSTRVQWIGTDYERTTSVAIRGCLMNRPRIDTGATDRHGSKKNNIRAHPSNPCVSVVYSQRDQRSAGTASTRPCTSGVTLGRLYLIVSGRNTWYGCTWMVTCTSSDQTPSLSLARNVMVCSPNAREAASLVNCRSVLKTPSRFERHS